MIILTRTNINVWDLAAGTSVYSWDGHGDWVQVICVRWNNVDDDEILLVGESILGFTFNFCPYNPKPMCFQLETRIAKDNTLLLSWKWIKILNQEIIVKAQPIAFQWERQRAEKNQTNATTVRMHHITQAIWGSIWKYTVEKRQINATSVTLHPLE